MKKIFLAFAFVLVMTAFFTFGAGAATQYTVVKGDSMWRIAVKFQVGLSEIISANPQIKSGNPALIYPGEVLTIPLVPQGTLSFEQQVITLTNQQRANNGLPALKTNWQLSRVARIKAQEMHDKNYFSHTSPSYGSPFDMMKSFGISYSYAGENIAMGYPTPQEVVNGWMNSPGHRANILNSNFTEIGVGYFASGSYWSQMFLKP